MRVAVLFGGLSEERDVSVASGIQAILALEGTGHDVVAIDTARGLLEPAERHRLLATGVPATPPSSGELMRAGQAATGLLGRATDLRNVDVVFIALHGGSGEDGTVQAVLDLIGVPYTGTGHAGSACAMDKDVAKRLFRSVGVPTPDWRMAPVTASDVRQVFGLPVVVKPNKQGSTVGLSVVRREEELERAIAIAAQFDDEVMIERFVAGRELTVGILEDQALAVGEIRPKLDAIFDYASKYQPGGADETFPAALPDDIADRVRALALDAHRAVKAGSYSRVDFRLDEAGHAWCLEVNTVPGMTETSLLPQSARAVGISFPELCDRICRAAVDGHRPKVR